ncbi:MAG: cytochrome c3 family protein [Nitrospiraceae bacterium]|nr:cytochrome c3 family protein [Nitrospiraceae bacterium]
MKKILVAIILLGLTAVIAYTVSNENPHDFSEADCPKCHVDASENPKVLVTSVTELCLPCHKKTIRKSSHPVDRVPVLARVPADLPLTNGKITCNTCHNIHDKRRISAFGGQTYFLRRASAGREFCVACHEVGSQGSRHVEIVASAHIGNRYTVTDASALLDPMSLDCIGCHDGTLAKLTNYKIGLGVWDHNQGSHPIGVDYRECRMKSGQLRPLSRVSRRLRLFNGKIGCGTCHDIYSKNPAMLTMTNEGSRMCLSCHVK